MRRFQAMAVLAVFLAGVTLMIQMANAVGNEVSNEAYSCNE
jgi:hypothetical protein